MLLEDLATELLSHIFLSCSTLADLVSLSSTCRRLRNIYASSQKLAILESVAEAEFGPLQDLTQLLTHNASQPTHMVRSVPLSIALLKQIVHAGRIAEKWCDMYPFKKWKYNYEHRRLLSTEERYRVRRAVYRLWLYTRAFHNCDHPRELRTTKLAIQRRAALLHNWSTPELAEIADVHYVLREVVHGNICPSNGTISRKFKKRYPESSDHPLHAHHGVGAEGWGDEIPHYYVVEDMLKLDPEQIIWLKENAPLKGMVESYVRGLGDWFENNGETWGQTLEWVLDERGESVADFSMAVAEEELGVAVRCD